MSLQMWVIKLIVRLYRFMALRPDRTIAGQRAVLQKFFARFKGVPGIECRRIFAQGVPVEWLLLGTPADETVVLYLHGGGYNLGSLDTHRELAARLALACQCRVLAVGYRLAPEHLFPAALEDAMRVYCWLLAEGVSAERIALVGDSAGGGLAIATLVALRYHGEPLPAAAVCLSPWVDLELTGHSMLARAGQDPVLTRKALQQWARNYLGGKSPRTPLASPLHADLSGLPPLLIQVGSDEILHDDAVRLAERAQAAGVRVELEVSPGMIHGWHFFAGKLPQAQQALARVAAFIRTHCRESRTPLQNRRV
ncbi:MAG: alpha/beta hydrolase [candidate division KSB1 bacterium]|nr:alpha/beta hydrolase [candidate division KSB1 bacterium]MDZ7274838.1 alpha/beta hydrolase [candidate division KSB1 bacterium]MDZ7288205.1 alpha/beta hydrolase [candidate division KSB1 bacterium]MDZ7300414.1 alpha/beta hydrolase [candidate division KSB1 bacterium]MDZ7308131.1 alpha/beta hydrolase [candidate division KSB1 bacterium]